MNANSNATISDFDALMDASMDDIDDLPPIGVPPSGSYDLRVSASREKSDKSGSEYIKVTYEVTNVNEIKDSSESEDVKAGQKFYEMFSPFKKDGTANEIGMGTLKERLRPFAEKLGTTRIGEILAQVKDVDSTAELVRRADRKDPEQFRFSLKNVVVL